jgi:hypothetical protein
VKISGHRGAVTDSPDMVMIVADSRGGIVID